MHGGLLKRQSRAGRWVLWRACAARHVGLDWTPGPAAPHLRFLGARAVQILCALLAELDCTLFWASGPDQFQIAASNQHRCRQLDRGAPIPRAVVLHEPRNNCSQDGQQQCEWVLLKIMRRGWLDGARRLG